MSFTLLSKSTRKARKPYRCIWCGQQIGVGETYERESSIYDGDFQDHKWHPECLNACHKENEEEFEPGGNERPTPPKP